MTQLFKSVRSMMLRRIPSIIAFGIRSRGVRMTSAVQNVKKTVHKIAVGQMCSKKDMNANFADIQSMALTAKRHECSLMALPECFNFMGEQSSESVAAAEALDGPIMQKYRQLAKETGLWLSLGGFQEKGPDEKRVHNTHVILDDNGNLASFYRKIHLFSFTDSENDIYLNEASFTTPGNAVVCYYSVTCCLGNMVEVCNSPVGRLGLSICYDARFPQLYQTLRFDHDAEILLIPSAFTVPTGKAHWETLLRARAIETQCYVIAAAQTNQHNAKRISYGHSLVVDPWGAYLMADELKRLLQEKCY